MDCPRCHTANAPDARFCEDCGASLRHGCPQCGAPITEGKRYCRNCSAALTSSLETLSDPFASPPHRYTPRHPAERTLGSKTALEGERKQVTLLVMPASMGLGYAEGLAGRLDQGIGSLRQGIARDLEVRNALWTSMARAHLPELCAPAGQPEQAAATAQEAMEIARAQHQPGPGAWALYALGRVQFLAASPELEQAQSALDECLRVANELGMRPLAANAHHRLGEVRAKGGNHDRARAELDIALRMDRDMDMRLWPEPVQLVLDTLG